MVAASKDFNASLPDLLPTCMLVLLYYFFFYTRPFLIISPSLFHLDDIIKSLLCSPWPPRDLLVAASKDFNASLWDLDGCCVGLLGETTWQLERRKTWRDPRGEARRQPLAENANLYLAQVGVPGRR